ncbi:MAG: CBS domain-containing protein [Thermodesulfovibrionales bacterium]|nr:CBS domain-containing protein [Thermodesulfovibrionales bacterium]
MIEVSKIMTKKVHTISPDSTLKECAKILKKTRVNGLVVKGGEKVVGVITKTDIFKAILPRYPENIDEELQMSDIDYIKERVSNLFNMKVKELMGTPPITVSSSVPIIRAGSIMLLRRVKQIPVVDQGKLTGIVTLTDIITNISKQFKSSKYSVS